MRKRKGLHQLVLFISLFLIVLFSSAKSYSADTNAVAYFPMQVGNVYVFYFDGHVAGQQFRIQAKILRDTTCLNGHKYYTFLNYPTLSNGKWYRVDSISGSLYVYDTSSTCPYYIKESFVDSLAALPMNEIKNCGLPITTSASCQSITNFTLFNSDYTRKRFEFYTSYSIGSNLVKKFFVRGFWLQLTDNFTTWNTYASEQTYTLLGCILNGIVYGDTSINVLEIQNLESNIPEKFSLEQNYPNPFNPLTNINFDIPKNSFVNLKIYDVTGKEIISLVNENLNVGRYNYQWDASNLTSGVYFYRLEASDFDETKRMVLVK